MSDAIQQIHDRTRQQYERQVANGEHDDQCEFRPEGFYICGCSKRARIAEGYTEPPGELIFHNPSCPRCDDDVEHDGDTWRCRNCRCSWDRGGMNASFDDDYGDDLAADLAQWEGAHARRRTEQEATR